MSLSLLAKPAEGEFESCLYRLLSQRYGQQAIAGLGEVAPPVKFGAWFWHAGWRLGQQPQPEGNLPVVLDPEQRTWQIYEIIDLSNAIEQPEPTHPVLVVAFDI
ncbi:MAG: hypothetical protein SNJ49_15355, partial [Chloracidobacterium sp.]